MPVLSCYRLKPPPPGIDPDNFDEWVEIDIERDQVLGPILRDGFTAKLYVRTDGPALPPWATFLDDPFGDPQWIRTAGNSAALLVRTDDGDRFAFTFGHRGRFMLRSDRYERGFGLRTALNLLAASDGEADAPPELRGVKLSRMGSNTRRSQQQLAKTSTIDEFELDTLRDIFDAATGRPRDTDQWGTIVTGGTALHLSIDLSFDELGTLCERLRSANERTDYQAHFKWVDYFQPVSDPDVIEELSQLVISTFKAEDWDSLDIAPPEIINWEGFAGFHYHFDRRPRRGDSYPLHRELRIEDYFRGVSDDLDRIDVEFLRRNQIHIRDAEDRVLKSWPVWRWLTGTLALNGTTYVLDAGDFFAVEENYLLQLNAEIDEVPYTDFPFPPAMNGELEDAYAKRAVRQLGNCLLLDRKLVFRGGGERGIEVCDLLTLDRRLIHLKRYFASTGLSHLFAQATTSAELLQLDAEFRRLTAEKIAEDDEARRFAHFSAAPVVPQDFEVVFAIIGRWKDRPASKTLPFLSKVNFRNAIRRLRVSNFRYSLGKVTID